MHCKRTVMTLALMSAGIGFATCTNIAFAATAGAQQTNPAPAAPADQAKPSTDQQAADKKKKAEEQKQAAQKAVTLGAIEVTGYASSVQNSIAIKR